MKCIPEKLFLLYKLCVFVSCSYVHQRWLEVQSEMFQESLRELQWWCNGEHVDTMLVRQWLPAIVHLLKKKLKKLYFLHVQGVRSHQVYSFSHSSCWCVFLWGKETIEALNVSWEWCLTIQPQHWGSTIGLSPRDCQRSICPPPWIISGGTHEF